MKPFDSETLAKHDGQEDRPTYIAHQGRVFDVSGSKLWRGGLHMKRHRAGRDLSTDFRAAPHGPEVLERYPQVGELKEAEAVQIGIPPALAWLLRHFPMLRRHPHPMTVHFPIAFMMAATVFAVLYLIFGLASLETTAFHCLGAGILFSVVTIATGFYTWWLNYFARPVRAVRIKQRLSLGLLAISLIVFCWRWRVPDVLTDFRGQSWIYLLLVLSFVPLITVIGWFGAALTFPVENE